MQPVKATIDPEEEGVPPFGDLRPVLFGELVFDLFPDGSRVLGGAPFNVAWHLQGFGANPLCISGVGDDALGREVFSSMQDWGMDTRGIQTSSVYPTGSVQVTLNEDGPCFDIRADQAYDHIRAEGVLPLLREAAVPLVYHGTLGLRHDWSHQALGAIRDGLGLPALVDINLRAPWWNGALVAETLSQARWGKLNLDELQRISEVEDLPKEGVEQMAIVLRARYGLDLLVVTRGEQGAMLVTAEAVLREAPPAADDVVDTVGAGDAFSAVLILGIIQQWPLPLLLRRALAFATDICRVRGATVADRALYLRHLRQWLEAG